MAFKTVRNWFGRKSAPSAGTPLIKKEFYDGAAWFPFATEYYVNNKSLSDFQPPLADISMNNYQITNVSTPVNPQDAANMAYVNSRIVPGGIASLTGFVEGVNPTLGVLTTTPGPTCLLTNIPAGGDVDMGGFSIQNMQAMPDDGLDAASTIFVMNLLSDNIGVQWL